MLKFKIYFLLRFKRAFIASKKKYIYILLIKGTARIMKGLKSSLNFELAIWDASEEKLKKLLVPPEDRKKISYLILLMIIKYCYLCKYFIIW